MPKFASVLVAVGVAAVLALGAASAGQAPPVAAPTKDVSVGELPFVRPEAQALEDFVSGVAQGLMSSDRVPGLTLVIVKNGQVLLAKGLGVTDDQARARIDPLTTKFQLGTLSGLITAIAAMQLVEEAHLLVDEDVGAALGERDREINIGDLLVGSANVDPELLRVAVGKAAGTTHDDYATEHVLRPLGMEHSALGEGGMATTAGDMSRLVLALMNGGEYGNARILRPPSVEQMLERQFTYHPALAGWSYGFAEIRRNGWRGVQRDGEHANASARLVLMPEIKAGYFVAVNGEATAHFWRALDDALFDRLFPPRSSEEGSTLQAPRPGKDEASAAAGTYQIESRAGYDILRTGSEELSVTARADGALVFAGAENAVLLPHAGGYWRSESSDVRAAMSSGRLIADTRVYRRSWRLLIYLVAGALAVLGVLAYLARRIARS